MGNFFLFKTHLLFISHMNIALFDPLKNSFNSTAKYSFKESVHSIVQKNIHSRNAFIRRIIRLFIQWKYSFFLQKTVSATPTLRSNNSTFISTIGVAAVQKLWEAGQSPFPGWPSHQPPLVLATFTLSLACLVLHNTIF